MRTMPTYRRGCWLLARTPASPMMPFEKPAANLVKLLFIVTLSLAGAMISHRGLCGTSCWLRCQSPWWSARLELVRRESPSAWHMTETHSAALHCVGSIPAAGFFDKMMAIGRDSIRAPRLFASMPCAYMLRVQTAGDVHYRTWFVESLFSAASKGSSVMPLSVCCVSPHS
ncbi:hypothetical protein ACQKWADRAFT_291385 [Trichoderma austrokoningii]